MHAGIFLSAFVITVGIGISYQSYSERFESDTPAGKMQFQMMALVGEFERNTIADWV